MPTCCNFKLILYFKLFGKTWGVIIILVYYFNYIGLLINILVLTTRHQFSESWYSIVFVLIHLLLTFGVKASGFDCWRECCSKRVHRSIDNIFNLQNNLSSSLIKNST